MPTLSDAYDIVYEAEKDLVQKLIELSDQVKSRIAEIKADLPEKGASSSARQYLGRVEANLSGVFGYDLESVKNLYGLGSTNPPAPTPVSSTT